VWWPFLVLVATTALLAWFAAVLSRHRDLGAGLVVARAGRAHAAPSLGSPVGLAVRLQRGSAIGWALGMAALAAAYGSIADSINDFVKDNQALTDLIAAQGSGTLVEQYLAMSFRVLALVATGFAIQSVLRIRSAESAGRAEPLLATPVSRTRWAASHLVVAFAGSLVVLVITGLAFGLTDAAVTGATNVVGDAVVGVLTFAPAVWVLAGLAAALVGAVPRATGVAWGALGVCFVIGMFGQLLGLPTWVQDVSPFQHVPPSPAVDVDAAPLVVLLALAVAFTGAGLAAVRRRDVG
jgi:ABC-2 type transport system permease protein